MGFAGRLKEARGQLSQKAAALSCGIKQQAWNTYENGKSIPGGEAIAKICRELHVSADWLLGLDETPPSPTTVSASGSAVIAVGTNATAIGHTAAPKKNKKTECAACPYRRAVERLARAGMTFGDLA